ncbi:MAG TPA: phosphate propanoyltransferase [Stenomitos sp.]
MQTQLIPVGVSNRHVHVSQADLEALFGPGYQLKEMRPLSQPGQYAAVEVVTLVGPKGHLEKVRILGPVRRETQVEIAQTDAYKLGVSAPVRDSGDLDGTPGLTIVGPHGEVTIDKGVILACRHIHMTPEDALSFGVKDQDRVNIRVGGDRPITFEGVLIRVSPSYALELHLDTDEANSALLRTGEYVALSFPGIAPHVALPRFDKVLLV